MKYNLRIFVFCILAILGCSFVVSAQQDRPPMGERNPMGQRPLREEHPEDGSAAPKERRPNLLRALGLSEEQINRIRQIHSEKRLSMSESLRRLDEANKALDDAIYANSFDSVRVESFIKAREAAQAEVSRIKTDVEISIRKLLTPEQLVKFRELRNRFERRKDSLRPRQGPPPREMMEKTPSI